LSDRFFANGSINFFNRSIDVSRGAISVVPFEGLAGVKEHVAGFGHHLVGLQLVLVVVGITFEFEVQGFAGGFNMFQGTSTMALVVVVCVFQQDVRVDQFLAGWFGVNARRD